MYSAVNVTPDGVIETPGNYFPFGSDVRISFGGRELLARIKGDRFSTPPVANSVEVILQESRVIFEKSVGWTSGIPEQLRAEIILAIARSFSRLPYPQL